MVLDKMAPSSDYLLFTICVAPPIAEHFRVPPNTYSILQKPRLWQLQHRVRSGLSGSGQVPWTVMAVQCQIGDFLSRAVTSLFMSRDHIELSRGEPDVSHAGAATAPTACTAACDR